MNKSLPTSLSVSISVDSRFFICGLSSGFRVFNCNKHFSPVLTRHFGTTGLKIAEMLEMSNIFAIVGNGTNKLFPTSKVFIWDDLNFKPILEIEFPFEILGVKMSSEYLMVLTQETISIFQFSTAKIIQQSSKPNTNNVAFDILSNQKSLPLFAFPGSSVGEVRLIRFTKNRDYDFTINPFPGDVKCVKFSYDGKYVALSSEDGILIHIYSLEPKPKFYCEFKRGRKKTQMHSLAFNSNSKLLAATCSSGTVHVFKIKSSGREKKRKKSVIKQTLKPLKSVCSFNRNSELLVVYLDGTVYRIVLDTVKEQVIFKQEYNYFSGTKVSIPKKIQQSKPKKLINELEETRMNQEFEDNSQTIDMFIDQRDGKK
ncbi:wd-repeat protein interacting with phosphoinosides wipi -related [Anaeramoeba flamelloides]|uniref:Wd-repeat protein interacting with phosphoinosides wipi -related n=1 Tax=Anaeramoeba flamelloides TaxID=1746091 RepID=A0ABQ8YI85_9EUKA|nr:wd-repeat protein interacting with phosphoinosides wipi -related [Anaeramoeba flamelloides]